MKKQLPVSIIIILQNSVIQINHFNNSDRKWESIISIYFL